MSLFCRTAFLLLVLVAWASPKAIAATREIKPQNDAEVLEVLAPRMFSAKKAPNSEPAALVLAKVALQNYRDLQEPRYLGRARALLQPWWESTKASEETLLIKASIEQSLHQFSAARKSLSSIVATNPRSLQAWLTLSSLDRLSGDYSAAKASCEKVRSDAAAAADARVYGDICFEDSNCHTSGTPDKFRALVNRLNQMRLRPEVIAWAMSLLAECEERVGQAEAASKTYKASLILQADSYTAISYADALLRQAKPDLAILALAGLPKSDSVILRLAHAKKMQSNAQWKMLYGDLAQRFRESDLRGDDPKLHARERAYAALWLAEDFKDAQEQAIINIAAQKEAIDWLILFDALSRNNDGKALQRYAQLLKNTNLSDQRLARWSNAK